MIASIKLETVVISDIFFGNQNILRILFFPKGLRSEISLEVRYCESYSIFKNSLLKFISTIPNSVFNIPNIYGIKILTRLQIGLSYIREQKFSDNFLHTINPFCSCSLEIESTCHFFMRCQNLIIPRTNFMNELRKYDTNILNLQPVPQYRCQITLSSS